MNEIKYACGECNAPALVVDQKVVRTCEHAEAPIAAQMSATAYGVGSTEFPK